MRQVVYIAILFLTVNLKANAQCCSAGNPVGGTTNIGILEKGTFRLISFYRNSQSEGYWEGSKQSNFNFVKEANFNYTGLALSYGLFNRFTIETELGYFINKSQTYNVTPLYTNKGFGLSNSVFSLKYNLISKKEKPFEWTVGLGTKFPFSKTYQVVNNVELPRDVQPSTNAFGLVTQSFIYKKIQKIDTRLFLINRFESNTPDLKNFKFGNSLINSLFISKQISKSNWTAILQIRHEFRRKDIKNVNINGLMGFGTTGTIIDFSGGNLIFIAPQINYTIAEKWNISIIADLPIYRNYNGIQLGNKYSFALYLSRDFGSKKCKTN